MQKFKAKISLRVTGPGNSCWQCESRENKVELMQDFLCYTPEKNNRNFY